MLWRFQFKGELENQQYQKATLFGVGLIAYCGACECCEINTNRNDQNSLTDRIEPVKTQYLMYTMFKSKTIYSYTGAVECEISPTLSRSFLNIRISSFCFFTKKSEMLCGFAEIPLPKFG